MPAYNGNTPFLTIDGTNVGTAFIEVNPDFKNSAQDVSAGTGIVHKQHAAGLNETMWKITLAYVAGAVGTVLPLIAPGTIHTIEYGPEGNVSGKPRHVQSVLMDSISHAIKVEKTKVAFTISATGASAPTVDMNNGGVY